MIQWEEEDKVNVVLYNQEIRCLQPRINNKALKTKQKKHFINVDRKEIWFLYFRSTELNLK